MDFTQYNKINCNVQKKFQNRQQHPLPSFPQNMPAFNQQSRQMFQNINHPPAMSQNPLTQSIGMQNCFGSPPPQPQRSAGDMNWNFAPKPSLYNPQAFGKDSRMSGQNNPMRQNENHFQDYEQHQNQETELSDEEDEVNIEYFQCSPPQTATNKLQNPFQPVMESMQQYATPQGFGKGNQQTDGNHQTYSFTHQDEGCEVMAQAADLSQHKMYRSHTRIVTVPNGVKIITEILKEDNDTSTDSDESSTGSNRKQQIEDRWINKQIEVNVEDMDSKELLQENSEE